MTKNYRSKEQNEALILDKSKPPHMDDGHKANGFQEKRLRSPRCVRLGYKSNFKRTKMSPLGRTLGETYTTPLFMGKN